MQVWMPIPIGLHSDTKNLVIKFASLMAVKLRNAEQKYGYNNGWKADNWMDECRAKMIEHIVKGDPVDVANYCAFLWFHGESTSPSLSDHDALIAAELLEQLEDMLNLVKQISPADYAECSSAKSAIAKAKGEA